MVILAEFTILVPTEHEYIDLSYSVLSIEDSSITKDFLYEFLLVINIPVSP